MPLTLSPVQIADKEQFEKIFSSENLTSDNPTFAVGHEPESGAQVCIELKKFVERSNGIFGKTGTGKTFITRTILCSIIKSGAGVNLIFDMHSEYGASAGSEDEAKFVPGLKNLFPDKVAIFPLDPHATKRRGVSADFDVTFDLSEITVEDILSLQSELNLHNTAVEAASLLATNFGKNWMKTLLASEHSIKELAGQIGAHAESLSALYRKIRRVANLPFITKDAVVKTKTADILIDYLNRGIHVVLEFGRQTSDLIYLLVSGILTRQIHREYVKKTENYLATKNPSDKPKPLIVTVEEAHNFLNASLAKQTIFGMIAREMRKYFVTLLIVDQRPSGICDEIISQLGTKLVAKLEDDKDLNSVFSGTSQQSNLKTLSASLASKKQALVLGHAIKMPIVVKTREYDEAFFEVLKKGETKKDLEAIADAIF